ncbi:RagB/SusD family nutrient uptake outer membrane protein [Flavobacterium chungangense]|uniref:RagB/SusD family nutrient uptake outer membrane protein n=1 Tax=Flavobacterium chungangense TaxID=554283 RepID=A0A6V6Z2H3_9FLAO|nr:RagB/SusD family nutrient uptake outer membrane protein [Flavobacterium chungangense]CAD0005142.1 RagB/SusD family nutrient uptake outer membrane protein [Flavobacterium chungangense]
MKIYLKSHRKSIATILLLTGILFTSCENNEDLNIAPETTVSDKDIFKTPARIEGLVNGIYKAFKGASLYGGRILLYQDQKGEDFINITANNFTGYESWNNSYSSGSNDVNNLWGQAYSAINNANILIEGLAVNQGVITEQKAKEYIGEAKLVRALAYYTLVINFGQPYNKDAGASKGVPLRLKAETGPANNDLARSTVAEIYTQILKDLDDAEAALPQSYSTADLNTTRAHVSTAIAIKTRVYLTQNNWAKVIEEAKKMVPQTQAPFSTTASDVKHALQPDITVVFSSNYATVESIFSIPMSSLDSQTGQSSIAYIYNTNLEYYLNPTGILGDTQWRSSDKRRDLTRTLSGKQYFKKYAKPSPFLDYIPVIRYSEVLLNYAEAAAKTGNLTLAANLLTAVHQRSDASYAFSGTVTSDPNLLIEAIWKERRIELLGEGFRGPDLLRNLQTLPAKGDNKLQTPAVPSSAVNYIFPPANTELAVNKLY